MNVDGLYRRVSWRLLPILLLAQMFAYLDRVNVGTAKLQMASALGLSGTAFGLGAGVFFIGYLLFEVPSNMLLHRLGARRWISAIVVAWGCVSCSAAFITSPIGFYIQRFLLGVIESGFFPGAILFMTYWFPPERRGRTTTLFMSATAVSGIIGSPLSGTILQSLDGIAGMAGWRWMFVIEALPTIFCGVAIWFCLTSQPRDASWLSAEEKTLLSDAVGNEGGAATRHALRLGMPFQPAFLRYGLIYFLLLATLYGVTIWMPTLIAEAGVSNIGAVGWLSAVPYALAIVVMNGAAFFADKHRAWRGVVTLSALVAAVGLLVAGLASTRPAGSVAALAVALAGTLTALPLFWNLPTAKLRGAGAAVGIAAINAVGNVAGFVAPIWLGWLLDRTGLARIGLVALAGCSVAAAALTWRAARERA